MKLSRSARFSTAIRRLTTARGVAKITALTATWCALWQGVSVANVLAGLLIAITVLAAGAGTRSSGRIRFRPLLKLLWIVLVDLVTSTIDVAKEIVSPTDYTDEAIIAVNIPQEGRHHFLLLIIAITLTPGTAVVDADPDTGTLYLHLLHAHRRAGVDEHVRKLTVLACEALPLSTRAERTPTTRMETTS